MFYVYVLKSLKNGDIYIGRTDDLKKRLKRHSGGFARSTKLNRPWKLVYYEAYLDKKDSTKREKQLKMHKPKSDLKLQIKNSLDF